MKRFAPFFLGSIIGVLFLFVGHVWVNEAEAQGPGPNTYVTYDVTIGGAAFTAQALNAAKQFDAVKIGGWSTALVEVQYTWNAATHVTMTCEESPDNSTWFQVPEISDESAGALDHYERTWRWVTGDASANFFFEVPMRYTWLRCDVGSVSGTASDTATIEKISVR